jgi:hypothetical protein
MLLTYNVQAILDVRAFLYRIQPMSALKKHVVLTVSGNFYSLWIVAMKIRAMFVVSGNENTCHFHSFWQ